MTSAPLKVLIAGGGVAALEAMIALRHLAEERVEIELVTPTAEFAYRPLAVAEPFGLGEPRRYDLVRMASDHGAALHLAGLQAVEPEWRRIITWDGRTLDFDVLMLAVGARCTTSIPGSVTVAGPAYSNRFRGVLRELEERTIRRVAFAIPPATSWPLPLYELALLTAARAAERGLSEVELSLVTPEEAPLEVFGARASSALTEVLAESGVTLHAGRHPAEFRDGRLAFVPYGGVDVDRVVSLPRLLGPAVSGIPQDPQGFIPVDLHGLVQGETDVYAAGDATTCPIKQGGVATQQADAAAEAIAARAGAPIEPKEFRPVLRGLLLTGSRPRFMRAEVSGGRGDSWAVSEGALWWPPSKIAARWFAPYLAAHHEELEEPPSGLPVEVSFDSPQVRRRAIIVPGADKKLLR
jgi:sulfide:quinone oxidoreductase